MDNSVAGDGDPGADPARRSSSFVHDALFYADEREFLDGTIPLLVDSLDAGTPVLVAVPPRVLGWLTGALGHRADKVQFIDITIDARNPNRMIPAVLRAFLDEHPGQPVTVVSEPMWPGRSAVEYPVVVQNEALVNVVVADLVGTVLCSYDRALEPETLLDACRTHPRVIASGERRASTRYTDPYRVVRDFNVPLPSPDRTAPVLDFDHIDDLPRLREFVGRQAMAAGLAHDRAVDLEMAANEIATNTIRHSGGPGSVRVWCGDGHVMCEITDTGHIDDPLAGRLAPPITSEGGRGLLVSNYLCDLVRLYSVPGLTAVRLFMRLS